MAEDVTIGENAEVGIAEQADGDARMALNLLDTCCHFVNTQNDKWGCDSEREA